MNSSKITTTALVTFILFAHLNSAFAGKVQSKVDKCQAKDARDMLMLPFLAGVASVSPPAAMAVIGGTGAAEIIDANRPRSAKDEALLKSLISDAQLTLAGQPFEGCELWEQHWLIESRLWVFWLSMEQLSQVILDLNSKNAFDGRSYEKSLDLVYKKISEIKDKREKDSTLSLSAIIDTSANWQEMDFEENILGPCQITIKQNVVPSQKGEITVVGAEGNAINVSGPIEKEFLDGSDRAMIYMNAQQFSEKFYSITQRTFTAATIEVDGTGRVDIVTVNSKRTLPPRCRRDGYEGCMTAAEHAKRKTFQQIRCVRLR